jgi:cbb3-type cytochrome oxidase subunit 1
LIYLGIGFSLGAVMLAAPGLHLSPMTPRLRPLHTELLLVGWMVQLAFGIAYWILPRQRGAARGNERLAWAALLLLNIGVLTVGLGTMAGLPAQVITAGRAAELLGALAFAGHAWPRARLYSPLRSPSSGNA